MAALAIDTFLVSVFDDQAAGHWAQSTVLREADDVRQNANYSSLITNVTTLSAGSAISGQNLQGFLYVPTLDSVDGPCSNASAAQLPANVTRQSSLADQSNLVALAPWTSADCARQYLTASRRDSPRALIFYPPQPGTSDIPSADDADSALAGVGDGGGGDWRAQIRFPVYAVGSSQGRDLVVNLAEYSRNASQIAEARNMTDPHGASRMFTMIATKQTPFFPWIGMILLLILGIVACLFALMFIVRFLVHRHMRASLRRRIVAGEVSLESIGVKRVLVPPRMINAIPCFVYVAEDGPRASIREAVRAPSLIHPALRPGGWQPELDKGLEDGSSPTGSSSTITSGPTASHPLPSRVYPGPEACCPICLEEFESGVTVVRELSCTHLYHPDCIDRYLRSRSSLCPMCKASVTPTGFCPRRITNAMVRREKLARLRAEGSHGEGNVLQRAWRTWWWSEQYSLRLPRRVWRSTRRPRSSPSTTSTPAANSATNDLEMVGGSSVEIPASAHSEAGRRIRSGRLERWSRRLHGPR